MVFNLEVKTTQVFSKRALGFLWAKRNDLDPGQVKILEALYNNRKKTSLQGSQTILYKLATTNAAKLGYGRLYGQKGSLETLEKECRGTLCKDYYIDIDIVNCHPVLLSQFAKQYYNKNLPYLDQYILNRDEYLAKISDNKDNAKQEFIRILYGGKHSIPFLEPLAKEIRDFTKFLTIQDGYKKLFDAVKHADNIYGTFLSYILQTEERTCMLQMKQSLETRGFSVDVLAYDGVMIRKQDNIHISDSILVDIEHDILQQCKYSVKLAIKPFSFYEITDSGEIAPKVLKSDYLEKKALFEQTYFYYSKENMIGEIQPNGSIDFYNLTHATTYLKTWDFLHGEFMDRTSFLHIWLNDPSRKTIKRITMKPTDDIYTYVQPIRYTYSIDTTDLLDPQPIDDDKYLEIWNTLIDLVANGNNEKRSYLINWFAHCIQKPYDLPGAALILTGEKGVGKDTLIDFFMEYVIGSLYCQNYTKTEQFWEKHDVGRMNKIVIKLEEAVGALNRQNDSAFKARITAKDQTFNFKNGAIITCENYNRYILTTNEANPVRIEKNDRRFVLFAVNPKYLGDKHYWGYVRNHLLTKRAGQVVGKYLESLDIFTFNPRVLPTDEFKDMIIDAEKTSEARFIDAWDGLRCTAVELYDKYCDFCNEHTLVKAPNSRSFGMKLLPFLRDNILKKSISMGYVYFQKINSEVVGTRVGTSRD
jgi:hypothetical protein